MGERYALSVSRDRLRAWYGSKAEAVHKLRSMSRNLLR